MHVASHARRPLGTRPRYVFDFLERRGLATKPVAGRLAVAQPPGAWIGGYEPNIAQRPEAVKPRSTGSVLRDASTRGSISARQRAIACSRCRRLECHVRGARRSVAPRVAAAAVKVNKQGVHGHKRSVPGQQWAKSYFKTRMTGQQGAVRAPASGPGAHLHLRPHGLRLRPHRQFPHLRLSGHPAPLPALARLRGHRR